MLIKYFSWRIKELPHMQLPFLLIIIVVVRRLRFFIGNEKFCGGKYPLVASMAWRCIYSHLRLPMAEKHLFARCASPLHCHFVITSRKKADKKRRIYQIQFFTELFLFMRVYAMVYWWRMKENRQFFLLGNSFCVFRPRMGGRGRWHNVRMI